MPHRRTLGATTTTATTTTATTEALPARADAAADEAYLAQRQSTMDSATLDKLLKAEKNLAQAGQATTNVWKLIGKLPSEEGGESPPGRAHSQDGSGLSSTNLRDTTIREEEPRGRASVYHTPPTGGGWSSTAPAAPLDLSGDSADTRADASPRYHMEIPRITDMGRSSLGSYASTAPGSLYERPLGFSSARPTMDTLSDHATSNFLGETGRSRSTHSNNQNHQNVFGFTRHLPPLSDVTLFTFTVKKSDSVLEKLGSKRASIQLQVDVDERMLYFLSAHDAREEYSCAAVTAKPQSRLGMQLKIQTGAVGGGVSKKITFYSTEDRANFVEALEQGKVMPNKKPPVPRPMLAVDTAVSGMSAIGGSSSSVATTVEDGASSMVSSNMERSRLRESLVNDHFTLLPGEAVLEHVQRVTNLVVMSQSDRAVQGVLKITSFRITFVPYDASWKFGSFELPLAAIDLITRDGLMLLITCKDLRTLRLAMHDAYSRKKGYDQLPSTPDFRWLNLLTLRMKPPNMIGALFAFDFHTEKSKERGAPLGEKHNGWFVYSPFAEYQRLGFLAAKKEVEEEGVVTWRLLKNSKFRFSPTYPQLMVVPSLMSEEQLVQSARFRSRARLPVVVWRHPVNKSVLSRSSQPNYGMAGNRSEADRLLLRAYRDSANKNSSGTSPPLHIIDARKPIATKGNRLKGKGTASGGGLDWTARRTD
ncbi:hypothetical protein BBJ28_00017390 [Nothophytophthora sp. Chile5]|nr:hypothetical protein BBJ28_00017390 [Nothophytophthora sp. Chile5]